MHARPVAANAGFRSAAPHTECRKNSARPPFVSPLNTPLRGLHYGAKIMSSESLAAAGVLVSAAAQTTNIAATANRWSDRPIAIMSSSRVFKAEWWRLPTASPTHSRTHIVSLSDKPCADRARIYQKAQGALDAPWAISSSSFRISAIAAARRVHVVGLKRNIGKSASDPSTLATTMTSRPAL